MRKSVILLPLLLCATPAFAQTRPATTIQVPKELTDPKTAEKLDRTMQAMTKAVLDLKVGAIQAAVEGRKATAAEKRLTVRDLGRRDDPNFDRNVQRQVAEAGPMIAQSMKAIADTLPAITKALDDAARAVDRAAANMPDPTYPKR
jgi:hypothetical protein